MLLALALVLVTAGVSAQTIEKPSVTGKTSFAVIIDNHTLEKCAPQVAEYKKTIEGEGLPTFVVSSKWESPEQVKQVLEKLYKENNLEGVVFIGEIPVAMVMKAQFMTSAYKMDERKFPLEEVAVPTDRFYDDFDLKFNKIADSTKGLHHFYELAPDSTPYIECDIYSARIVGQKSNGCSCKQIAAYLEKAVREHKSGNKFDQFTSYTGEGSYSNSITAWKAEQEIVNEQFPGVFKKEGEARYLRYSMADYMKPNVIKELRRPELDFMVFHEHGDWFRMYLSGNPGEQEPVGYLKNYLRVMARRNPARAKARAEELGLDSTWYADYNTPESIKADSLLDINTGIVLEDVNNIAPNARMVVFDACYNGDFRNPEFIAGKFIMSKGSCVVGFANSVNVLQDKSAFDLMGLLGNGVRVGLWAQHINILESHLFGDPTFHFAANPGDEDLNSVLTIKDNAYWASRLDDKNPEVQNMAEIKLFEGNYPGISDILLKKFKESPYAIVRYNSMHLLEKIGDKNYWEVLKLATTDHFEFIRRIAVTRMGQVGAEEFLPYIVAAYENDRHATRIVFDASGALVCFDKDAASDAINNYFQDRHFYNADKDRAELLKLVEDNPSAESIKSILDKDKKGWRISYIQFMRNRPYHQNLTECLKVLEDPDDDVFVRTVMAEALAWWELSYRKQEIIDSCKKLLADPSTPDQMKPALISAVTRLSSKK